MGGGVSTPAMHTRPHAGRGEWLASLCLVHAFLALSSQDRASRELVEPSADLDLG